MRYQLLACASASAIGFLPLPAQAQETVTYQYDALGRLSASVISGGPNNGIATATCFDPAGNRTQYFTGSGAPPACASLPSPAPTPTPGPTPTPAPAPTNQPPIATNDTFSLRCWTSGVKNLTANDSDPDGNLPLTLKSIVRQSGSADATIISASSVSIDANDKGPSVFSYVVADSLGATATGKLTVTSTGTLAVCEGESR